MSERRHGEGGLSPDWREPFDWEEPEAWRQAESPEDLAHGILNAGPIEAGLALLANRLAAKENYNWEYVLHTPPAAEHYRHTYLWDSAFFMMIYSQAALFASKAADHLESMDEMSGRETVNSKAEELRDTAEIFKRAGVEEGFWLMGGQQENGFLANVQYESGFKWYEVEKAMSLTRPRRTSNYSQPPVVPLATLAVYKSMEQTGDPNAKLYLEEMFGSLAKMIGYWTAQRRNAPEDPLIGVIEPHETGMDSLRQWDYIKPHRRPRHPEITQEEADRNMFADGAHFVVRLLERRILARGSLEKQRALFWANDVSMNCIYFHNIQAMVRISGALGKSQHSAYYQALADEVEQAMLDKLWQEDPEKVPKPGFYSLDDKGEPIKTITISNLFGLVLPHLAGDKLAAMLDMMDQDFDAPYPLPSDSINSPEYDPHNQEKDRLWRGPTWINTNYYLVEHGLRMQAERPDISQDLRVSCLQWAERIAKASNELIDINGGAYEHYDPETAAGQRPRVINFGWTWLARLMRYQK